MSYLDLPRLHFGGLFFTGPGTINNQTGNYTPTVQLEKDGRVPSGGFLESHRSGSMVARRVCRVERGGTRRCAGRRRRSRDRRGRPDTQSNDSDERWSGRLLPPGADGRSRPGSAGPERSLRRAHGRHPRERRRPDGGNDDSRAAAIESTNAGEHWKWKLDLRWQLDGHSAASRVERRFVRVPSPACAERRRCGRPGREVHRRPASEQSAKRFHVR